MTGGVTLSRALQALAPFGRMVVYGQASRQPVYIDVQRLVVPNHSITGFYLGAYIGRRDLIRSTLEELIGYVLDERLELQVRRGVASGTSIGGTSPSRRAQDHGHSRRKVGLYAGLPERFKRTAAPRPSVRRTEPACALKRSFQWHLSWQGEPPQR